MGGILQLFLLSTEIGKETWQLLGIHVLLSMGIGKEPRVLLQRFERLLERLEKQQHVEQLVIFSAAYRHLEHRK